MFATQGVRARRGGYSWEELQRLNKDIQSQVASWINAVLDQHEKEELGRRNSHDRSGTAWVWLGVALR